MNKKRQPLPQFKRLSIRNQTYNHIYYQCYDVDKDTIGVELFQDPIDDVTESLPSCVEVNIGVTDLKGMRYKCDIHNFSCHTYSNFKKHVASLPHKIAGTVICQTCGIGIHFTDKNEKNKKIKCSECNHFTWLPEKRMNKKK